MSGAKRNKKLPDGWRWVRLGEIIHEALPGFACGLRDPNSVIQLRMNNVSTDGSFVWDEYIRVPADELKIEKYRIEPDDVMFNNTNSVELVGKSALFRTYKETVVYSNHFTRLRTKKERLTPSYLASWLNFQWRCGIFAAVCNRWIGQAGVKNDKLFALEIPLPPLSEQERITALLNEQMEAVDKARKAAEERLEVARALPVAYLREVFEGPEAKKWPKTKISKLCKSIDYGYTASANFSISEPRFLRITDIQNGKVDWSKVPGCQVDNDKEAANALKSGDIVFARTGGTTGKSFQIKDPPRAVFASYLIRLHPGEEITSDFLYAFFQSDNYWTQVRRNARGGAQPNVNASLLGDITLPHPPMDKQHKIMKSLTEKFSIVDLLTKTQEQELETIHALSAALLQKAFNGEL